MTVSSGGERGALEILDGGVLTTIQDDGRPDWTHLGVPISGAADPWSLAIANILVGNQPGQAAVEMTMVGPRLRVPSPVTIGLAGADLGGRIVDGRRLEPGRSHRLRAGDVVSFEGQAANAPWGARAYLALPGGVDIPVVLGSRSTCLAAGFGGLDGRPLAAGDTVTAGRTGTTPELTWPIEEKPRPAVEILRVLPSGDGGFDALVDDDWMVASSSDRVGVRLEGRSLRNRQRGESATQGVTIGTIQVPSGGQPIVLGPDHQTTGGYRVAGVVITADIPTLGQLAPGTRVQLRRTDRAEAIAALRGRLGALRAGAATLRDDAAWEILAASAGG